MPSSTGGVLGGPLAKSAANANAASCGSAPLSVESDKLFTLVFSALIEIPPPSCALLSGWTAHTPLRSARQTRRQSVVARSHMRNRRDGTRQAVGAFQHLSCLALAALWRTERTPSGSVDGTHNP